MTCSLTTEQLENLFRAVYTEMALSRNEKRPFDMKAFALSVYQGILEKSSDPQKAASFVQQIPEFALSAMTVNSMWTHLDDTGFDPTAVMKLARTFKDENTGMKAVADYLGTAPATPEQIQKAVEIDQDIKDKVQPDAPELPGDGQESAKPTNPFSTTMQTARFWDPNRNPAEFAERNQIDADKKFHNDVIKSVSQAIADANGDSSKARIGYHMGFKLKVMPASEFPFEFLYKETQLWMTGPKFNPEVHNSGLFAVLADNYGELLYFDKDGKVTDRFSGKPVYASVRRPKEINGKLMLLNYDNTEQLLSPEEMLRKEEKNASKMGNPYTPNQSLARLDSLRAERQQQLQDLAKLRDFLTKNKSQSVLLDITGGTLGIHSKKWSPIGQFITDEEMKSITLDKSKSRNEGGGRYTIKLKGISEAAFIDRPRITADLANKIATILTTDLKVEGELMSNSSKVDYVKQFIQNGNEFSNNMIIVYDTDTGGIILKILGQDIRLPSDKNTPQENEQIRKVASGIILDKLMNVAGKKDPSKTYPSRMSINDDLVVRGEFLDYIITGDNAVPEIKDYYKFLRENAKVNVEGTDKMQVTDMNAYLKYAFSEKALDQIYGRETQKEVAPEIPQAPTPHDSDVDSDLLKGLLKARGLPNDAAPEEIHKAKTWYESSPLSKFIPFNAMFNIVNSDAFAQWTVNGITLFEGSNYTDLYHEAWHGFTQLFLTKQQKTDLYKEVRGLSGTIRNPDGSKVSFKNATDFEAEEFLAEDFRKYVLSGGKKIADNPVRNNIFRRIYNFLKQLFSGMSVRDIVTQRQSTAKIKAIYDKLFYGQINEYSPSIDNIQFSVLNKGVEPIELGEQLGPKEQALSLEESRVLVDSIDSLISEAINAINRNRGNATATTQLLTERDKLSQLYENIKTSFEKRRAGFAAQAEKEEDAFVKRKLQDNIRLLNYAITNFGDPNKVLSEQENKGLVYYHQQKTKFLGVSQRIYDISDEATSDEDIINKGMRRNDRSGNELSLKELANDETLYLVRSLHKIEDGKPVRNRLDIPELVDFDTTWNKLVRTLEGSFTPEEMYNRIAAAQVIFPEFTQLLGKLADPSKSDLVAAEFDMNTKFWQDFNKPRVPLVQMILDKSMEEDSNGQTIVRYDMRIGQASADYFKVLSGWKNRFRTDSPQNNKYISQDAQRHNYLDTEAIMRDFSDSRGELKDGTAYDFLRAVGLYFDQANPIMRDMLNSSKSHGIGYIFNTIKAVNKALALARNNQNNAKQQATLVAARTFILDPIEGLRKPQPDLGIDSNAGRIKALAEFYAKYSDDYSDFGVVNAENNKQYEHTLNNTLTIIIGAINKARSYQELTDPEVDTDGHFKHMRWLDIRRNPLAASSVWLNSVFDLDRFRADGTPNPDFGKKRVASTEEGAGPVKINLENLSGVQIVINGLYPETGIATSRSDRTTKFLSDFHMMVLTGRMELMRHASKSSAYDIVLSSIRTDLSKKDSKLYVDTDKFISPRGSESYDGFGLAFRILQKYAEAELNRIRMINSNLSYYKTVSGYNRQAGDGKIAGQVFTAFDDVFTPELKDKLYALQGPLTAELTKPENEQLRNEVKSQMKLYFDRLVDQNEAILNEAGTKYIHQKVYDKVRAGSKTLSNEQVEKAAMRSFTYNSWIHNFESAINIYGDLAQYNHSKEEFHKRNAGTGSTGYTFRTDRAAQIHINEHVGKKYAESIGVTPQGYDGRLNTAIFRDSTVTSVYFGEYQEAFVRYYDSLYEARKDMSDAQKRTAVKGKVDAAMAAYRDMKEGDGQGWITFDSYRILRKLEGKWTDAQEKLYQRIVAGENPSSESIHEFFPTYKVQYYGPMDTQGLPITAFHKFSLFPLIPSVIKGTNMQKVHDMMVSQNIDYALFESGSKVGSVTSDGKFDELYTDNEQRIINEDLKFTKNVIFANYLKDQLDIHAEFKGKVIFSTQLRKLIEEGLFEFGLPVDFLAGASPERRIADWAQLPEDYRLQASELYALAKRYENNIRELSELKKQELLEEAGWKEDANGIPQGDLKDLLDLVRRSLTLQDIADHQLDFIDVDEKGNLKWDLSMHLNADKIERLLTAMVNNRLVRQKVQGESLVQVSSSLSESQGLGTRFQNPTREDILKYRGTNDLPTYHKGKDGKTAAMKVKIALQGDFTNLLRLQHMDGSEIGTRERLNEMLKDENWLAMADNRKAITIVGVRIPVQGLNSMEFMEVYEFLPAEAGNIIIPPSEIVAKSGADFDIDKLTVFMPAIGREGNYLRRTSSIEEVKAAIAKLKEKHSAVKEQGLKLLEEAKKERDMSKEFGAKDLARIEEAMQLVRTERTDLLDEIGYIIQQLENTSRMPASLVSASEGTESDFMKELAKIHSKTNLSQIDSRVAELYQELLALKSEKMESLYRERDDVTMSMNDYRDQVSKTRNEMQEKTEPFRKELSRLKELKKRYTSTVENRIIEDIRGILEQPANYISLIRPNGTDIVRPIADDATIGLAQYVQDFDPRETYAGTKPKKGVSPTRVLEMPYNLYKHESNNIGKRTLGIGAVENTYSTIFNRIGAYMNDSWLYSNRKGKQRRRIQLLLPHNQLKVVKTEAKENPLVAHGINPADFAGRATVAMKIADMATKFIGFETTMGEEELREKSSTLAYREAWGDLSNFGEYDETDVVMVGGQDNPRPNNKPYQEATANDFMDKYMPELSKAAEAGASFIVPDIGPQSKNVSNYMTSISNSYQEFRRPGYIIYSKRGAEYVKIIEESAGKPINQPAKRISLSNLYDASNENRIADVISQLMNGWVDIEKDAWVFFVQGNNEITPTLLFLIKSGVPFKQAAWFVSQPLVREYVREQRLARSTFSGPLGKAPDNPLFYRFQARKAVFNKYLKKDLKPVDQYRETIRSTNKVLGKNGQFSADMIERIVKEKDTSSEASHAAFLHFLEIEEMMKGIANLKFKTNFDTRRSTTLFDAVNRIAEIEMLRDESRLPTELIDKVLEESVIGSFFVQDFQLKLWGKLFTLRNNDVLTNYLKNKLKDRGSREEIESTFGDDAEKYVSEFKNDLLQFIFQNALRDFNLGLNSSYKGYSVQTKVPIAYVDKLEFGAFVKKGENGEATMYVDPKQLQDEWASKDFLSSAKGPNSYKSRGLATMKAEVFMWRGTESEKEYYKFVVEREYLRTISPFEEYEQTGEYRENYENNFKSLAATKADDESPEDYKARIRRATYEQMLRNRALENTFNPWKLFSSDTSIPLQFLQIVQRHPHLEKEYGFIAQLAVVSDPKLGLSNLTLKDKDTSSDKVNRYYENLKNLSDPGVEKVPDAEENARISAFFAKLPLFAFLQSGLSKNPYSFTAVVPYDPFVRVMEGPVKEFTEKVLGGPNATEVLDTFSEMFARQNSRNNRKMRSKFKNYLMSFTPAAMREMSEARQEKAKRNVYLYLDPLRREGMYSYSDRAAKGDKKTADYRAMVNASPDVVFIYNDNLSARSIPGFRDGTQGDLRAMGKSLGVLTSGRGKDFFKSAKPEEFPAIKDAIEADIQEIINVRDAGKDIAFSDRGYGDRSMPQEIFAYLSERLYQEFGYINPGSASLPSVKEIIGQHQGITQNEIDEFMRQCFNP